MEYKPDDGGLTAEVLEYLEANPALIAAAGKVEKATPAEVERLRKGHSAEAARGAMRVAEARRKAKMGGKFVGVESVWGSPEAVEQATSTRVARHKATRIAEYLGGRAEMSAGVWDFCAGVGGDAAELARVAPVTAIEMSAARVWCLSKNCGGQVGVRRAAVDERLEQCPAKEELRGAVFHCDPSRRSAGKRRHLWDDMIPGPAVLAAMIERFGAGAIKLSPAVDFASLPEGEVEVISTDGSVVQAVLWVGGLARGKRSATVMRGEKQVTVRGEPDVYPGDMAEPAAFVFEVDGAVHRAGLAGMLAEELGLRPVNNDGGYLTGEGVMEHAALTRFRHIETVGFSEKKVIEALRKLPANGRAVEIKTRGGLDVDTDALQKKMTAASACGATVMIYRGNNKSSLASICRREE